MRSLLFFVIFSMILSLTACQTAKKKASKSSYYETTMIKTPVIKLKQKDQLIAHIIKNLKGRSLTHVTTQGDKKVAIQAKNLKKLPFVILKALWMTSDRRYYGAEFDLKLKDEKNQGHAVSIWINPKGKMKFSHTPWPQFKLVKSIDTLQKKWKLGGMKNSKKRKWSPLALTAVDYAFRLISENERSLLDDIPIIRRKENAQQKSRGALYIQEGDCDAKIVVYDLAVKSQSYQFVGNLKKIYPATTMTMLHEIGHAIHQRKLRELQCAYIESVNQYNHIVKEMKKKATAEGQKKLKLLDKKIKKSKKRMKRWLKNNPMLNAYKKIRGKRKGPTMYGKTSIKESFAEAFALYRADPDALQRVYPKVYNWFKAQKHLKHLDFSD